MPQKCILYFYIEPFELLSPVFLPSSWWCKVLTLKSCCKGACIVFLIFEKRGLNFCSRSSSSSSSSYKSSWDPYAYLLPQQQLWWLLNQFSFLLLLLLLLLIVLYGTPPLLLFDHYSFMVILSSLPSSLTLSCACPILSTVEFAPDSWFILSILCIYLSVYVWI